MLNRLRFLFQSEAFRLLTIGVAYLLHVYSAMRNQRTAEISQVIEAALRLPDGRLLGYVDELLIDLGSGRIEYVMARGLHGQRLRFSWGAIAVKGNGFVLRHAGPRLVPDGGPDAPQGTDEHR